VDGPTRFAQGASGGSPYFAIFALGVAGGLILAQLVAIGLVFEAFGVSSSWSVLLFDYFMMPGPIVFICGAFGGLTYPRCVSSIPGQTAVSPKSIAWGVALAAPAAALAPHFVGLLSMVAVVIVFAGFERLAASCLHRRARLHSPSTL
jgi:hypothetical protein